MVAVFSCPIGALDLFDYAMCMLDASSQKFNVCNWEPGSASNSALQRDDRQSSTFRASRPALWPYRVMKSTARRAIFLTEAIGLMAEALSQPIPSEKVRLESGGRGHDGKAECAGEVVLSASGLRITFPPITLCAQLDAVLNFDRARTVLAGHYSHLGRPSIDPELMLRMLLVGYAYGIRSERQLCSEVHLNLAYRWFCRLGLEGAVPDLRPSPKTAMAGFGESDVYRVLFEEIVEQCRKAGLVPGEGFAVDGSFVHGDARRDRRVRNRRGRSGRQIHRQGRCGRYLAERSMPVIRRMRAELNISLRPIPPPLGIPRKAAAGSVTSPTI